MTVRLLRGQVVVREIRAHASSTIWVPEPSNPRDVRSHRGRVLALGPPATTRKGAEVPHGFDLGDEVVFHWNRREKDFTRPWIDGEDASWVSQEEIDAVVVR